MNSLAKLLLDSSWAAAWVGPKTRNPRRENSSTMPTDSGSSGPTTVICGWIWWATFSISAMLRGSPGRHVASAPMPPLPGTQKTSETREDCRSFQTSACSRPPLPMTRTFMRQERINQNTRPLHHGDTETRRKTENKWVLSEPPIPGCIKTKAISAFSLQQKNEDTHAECLFRLRHYSDRATSLISDR